MRNKYGNIIATNFEFLSKIVTCVELLNSKIEKIGTFGIKGGEPIIVVVILKDVEETAR